MLLGELVLHAPHVRRLRREFDRLVLQEHLVDRFARFARASKAPAPDSSLAQSLTARRGSDLFDKIGCAVCHVRSMTTAPAGTKINGGAYTVPAALGNKVFHPYGDFLLHDVGTGDGIIQAGPADTANKLRTVPLWGLHIKSRFMHDNGSTTLNNAIQRHGGEAQGVIEAFKFLSTSQQQQLITFLKSL